jgi:hypothetical protein
LSGRASNRAAPGVRPNRARTDPDALFRVELSTITGNAPSAGGKRPIGHGSPAELAGDPSSYRETAGLDAFQINFHGNRNLDQLLQSMECFMQDLAPIVSGERIGSKS